MTAASGNIKMCREPVYLNKNHKLKLAVQRRL